MAWQQNIVGMAAGNYRSLTGYAAENIAVGRAMLCGYDVSVQGWRDGKYDGILENKGVCFRFETKGTTGASLSTTAGGRAGGQIIPGQRAARQSPLSKENSDFLIGVKADTGLCWVVPTELVDILQKNSFTLPALTPFEEKWSIFAPASIPLAWGITLDDIRVGFRDLSDRELDAKIVAVSGGSIPIPQNPVFSTWQGPRGTGMRPKAVSEHELRVLILWMLIFESIP